MKSLINPNIFEEHYIATAKELKEMSKTNDYQSIKDEHIQIDFSFNADFGTEYQVDIMPLNCGKTIFRKAKSFWFDSYRKAKQFIRDEIAKRGN